jgi:hypothetical protein
MFHIKYGSASVGEAVTGVFVSVEATVGVMPVCVSVDATVSVMGVCVSTGATDAVAGRAVEAAVAIGVQEVIDVMIINMHRGDIFFMESSCQKTMNVG